MHIRAGERSKIRGMTGDGKVRQKSHLPRPPTRDTQKISYIECYVKKVDQEKNHITEGTVIPEKQIKKTQII